MVNNMETGLMKIKEYSDGTSFWRVACDCHEPNHDVKLWFDPDPDLEYLNLNLTMEVGFHSYGYGIDDSKWEAFTRRVRSFNKRLRHAAKVLFTGYATVEGDVVLSEDGVKAMKTALDRGLEHFENVKKQRKKKKT